MTRAQEKKGTGSHIWLESYLTLTIATEVALTAGVTAALLYLLMSLASVISTAPAFFRLVSAITSVIVSAD